MIGNSSWLYLYNEDNIKIPQSFKPKMISLKGIGIIFFCVCVIVGVIMCQAKCLIQEKQKKNSCFVRLIYLSQCFYYGDLDINLDCIAMETKVLSYQKCVFRKLV